MQNLMSEEEIEALAIQNASPNGHAQNPSGSGNSPQRGTMPSGTTQETVYEFSMTPKSGRDALSKGVRAAKAGTKTVMATRRAYERRKEIERQARRQKTKDVLQIFGIITSIFT